jgi:exopolyphosphatase/guanosine-5'-triphosphate,3'-diphosphate pyrophosphatase
MSDSPIAAIDLGSNSFRLQIARVVDEQIYPVDSIKETVRLGAGITEGKALSQESMQRALATLARFGERLRGFPLKAVRAVGTNSFRVTTNGPAFLKEAEKVLGYPIDIIAGREEARLIYLGAAHSLPNSKEKRLIVDIGGGSTEFIIGAQYKALETDSLVMGCVSYSQRYFPDGAFNKAAFHAAEFAARDKIQTLAHLFNKNNWTTAIGTSGTSRALIDILELNDYSTEGITADGMDKLKQQLIKVGHISQLNLNGLRSDRLPVLAGGLAIMIAIFDELHIEKMQTTPGALRDGLLYDLIGRGHPKDLREGTIKELTRRYHIDKQQADWVSALAVQIFDCLAVNEDQVTEDRRALQWAAQLHEIGRSIAYSGYHKHSAYILRYADMPGFTEQEQARLANAVLAHRGNLKKLLAIPVEQINIPLLFALRLASIFYRSRCDIVLPAIELYVSPDKTYMLVLPDTWLAQHPLTAYALENEVRQWQNINIKFFVKKIPAKS